MSRKFALVIGNTEYGDPGLLRLSAPGQDAQEFARVLKDKTLCAFNDVRLLINEPSASVIESIDEFFDEKKPDDLLVLYFSGHGVRDELGSLYLAFKNTIRTRLRATAIKSDYLRESMDQSRSKRQVVVLDCCNSGAFPQGTKAEIGGPMGLRSAFQGYGRFVLMASDATQFAWEGDRVIGETSNSLFTHFLVKGLEGEADSDGDGKITVDELYDYAFEEVSKVTEKQTPTKAASKVEGDIVLREITRLEDIKPIPLPSDLLEELEDTRPYVRAAVVEKLERILNGKNLGMARSASAALERIVADENTTRHVAELAQKALQSYREGKAKAAGGGVAASSTEAGPTPAKAEEPRQPGPAMLEKNKQIVRSRALDWRKPPILAGGIFGLVLMAVLALWLSGSPLFHGATPIPTERAAVETATPAEAETPGTPTTLAAATAADQGAATSTVAAAQEPRMGSPEESLAIWNDNNSSIVDKALAQNAKLDDSQPGTFTYPISVSRSDRVRWEWFWCANSQSILEDNLSNIQLNFQLDGQDVTPLLQNTDFQYSGASCRAFFVAVSDWPRGTFRLSNTATLTRTINDGSSDYAPGDYVYNYDVTAK